MIDNLGLFEMHEREQQRALKRLPVCESCGEPITYEFCYKINGELICEACINECRVDVERLIEYERD